MFVSQIGSKIKETSQQPEVQINLEDLLDLKFLINFQKFLYFNHIFMFFMLFDTN